MAQSKSIPLKEKRYYWVTPAHLCHNSSVAIETARQALHIATVMPVVAVHGHHGKLLYTTQGSTEHMSVHQCCAVMSDGGFPQSKSKCLNLSQCMFLQTRQNWVLIEMALFPTLPFLKCTPLCSSLCPELCSRMSESLDGLWSSYLLSKSFAGLWFNATQE